jgi:hypothetical protein
MDFFFCSDLWIKSCPLKVLFPAIYACCEQQNKTVAEVMGGDGLNLTFCRSFGPEEVEEWDNLRRVVEGLLRMRIKFIAI